MNPINSVSEFLNCIEKGRILVALSGGGDSVCLLSVLKELGADICAFHLNHGIRGEEADRDQAFCRDLCNELGITFYTKNADIPAISKECGKGIEETARAVRYQLLNEIADASESRYIATAHNGDDNAETVIFNLVRGCSSDGLCGIPAVRGSIIRPLLNSTRAEIDAYLEERQIQYVTDSTNSDESYTRNKIRNDLIPKIENKPEVAKEIKKTEETAFIGIFKECFCFFAKKRYSSNKSPQIPQNLVDIPPKRDIMKAGSVCEPGAMHQEIQI